MSEERSLRELEREVEELRNRLRESEEALRAIRRGDVDALLVEGPEGPRAYTLDAAARPYRVLVEQMRDAALILSGDGVVLYCNGRLREMLELSRSAVVGSTFSDLTVPDDRDSVRSLLERGLDEPAVDEVRLRPGGAEPSEPRPPIPVRLAASPLKTKDLRGVCVVVTDLAEVKRRERIESQERLTRAVVEHAATAIVVVDAEGRITRMNRLAGSLLGPDAEGAPLEELLPLPDTLEALTARGGVHEVSVEDIEGRRSLLVGVRALGDDLSLATAHWIVTLMDISERRAAEERLRFQAQLLDTVGEAVIATDLEGRIVYWNSGAERLYGWAADEVLGEDIMEHTVAPESRDHGEEIMDALRRGETFSGEFMLRRRDGSTFPGAVTDSPIHDRDGRLVGVVGISRDLTELKAMEQQLRQAQKLQAIGQLAGGVAHDFNNILTAIQGHTELLLEECDSDDPMHADLVEVAANADRAAGLTAQLLAFSRQQMLRPRILDLTDVVKQTETLLRRLIGEDIEFEVTSSLELEPVEADRQQLELVLMNLALNARDAMPEGGRLKIELDNVRVDDSEAYGRPDVHPGRYVSLAVSDTGVGIEESVLDRMYEPFFTTKEKGRGTGLGLSTVHGIVTQSDGFIFAETDPGRGTRFEILLPRAEGEPDMRGEDRKPEAEGGPETILLVEDEDAVRRLARRVLERVGYRILEACDPVEALERVAPGHDGPIHLLLTDVVMPEMTGVELAELLGRDRGDTRVLLMSGYTESEIGRRGVAGSGDAFLQKPFTPDVLVRKVRDILDA